jgi:hypothetical protein
MKEIYIHSFKTCVYLNEVTGQVDEVLFIVCFSGRGENNYIETRVYQMEIE